MGRLSRGCFRCRERRVRCDEGQPSCHRCIRRNEVCEGYRDDASLIFRHETDKTIEHAQASLSWSSARPQKRSTSVDAGSAPRRSSGQLPDGSSLTPEEADSIKISHPLPWLRDSPKQNQPRIEDQAVDLFMDKYVLYPCSQASLPGFLEHLPSMFKEVNRNGRHALRYSVRAAAYADLSRGQKGDALARKALQCYGMALKALGESLAAPGKEPDDHDLMTVVILDIFETLYAPEQSSRGSHSQGMAQILRLRGADMVYNSRGWSLFRLAHHRIQKQQLAYSMSILPESAELLDKLNSTEPYVRLEGLTKDINETCTKARSLLGRINAGGLPISTVVQTIRELHSLDQTAVGWRQTPQHASFVVISAADRPDLKAVSGGITDTIQLHPDLWLAYEWNYHRASRMIFLEQLLKCSYAALEVPGLGDVDKQTLTATAAKCVSTVQWLADEILATVPQTFGDVNCMGQPHNFSNGPPRCRAIGGYLLLWPSKTVKNTASSTTQEQKERGLRVFERIAEYTGMKAMLGDHYSI